MGSQSRVPQVLIMGAGIAGLAATGAIRGLGWDVSVVEHRADLDGIGTGLFVPANRVRALAALGVLDGMACRGRRIGRLRVRSADGSAQAVARLDRVWPAVGSSIAIHRSLALEALLEAALAAVRMGVRLTGVAAADGRVRAAFDAWHAATPNMAQGAAMPPKTSWCSPRSWAATRGVRRSMNRCAGLPPAGCRGSATCRRPPPCATAWRRCRCSSGSGSCPLGGYQQGVLRAARRQAMSKPTTEEL